MPYVNNDGVWIHYEVEGEGPPLVLMHGLGASLEGFRIAGWMEALRTDYRLIMIDARGHGASHQLYDPEEYRLTLMVGDVVAVLDDLAINRAHFHGYSMGGDIGWGIMQHAPDRFQSLVLGGAQPYREDQEGPDLWLDALRQGMDAYLAISAQVFGSRWTDEVRAIAQATDLEAQVALVSLAEWMGGVRGIEELLPTVTLPCLLFVGEDDPAYPGAKKAAATLPHAEFVSLPGLDHIEAAFRPDLVLPHVRRFLAEVGEG